ncbi:MAG TPA: ABC transporter substrate binding protein [Dehalococcoidia bacterium]|nr:ABC transporter substrate binding protein [Dehalococcoidia bacterium]
MARRFGRRRVLGGLAVVGAVGAGAPLLVHELQRTVFAGEPPHLPRIAYLGSADEPLAAPFVQRLAALGWADGKSMRLLFSGTSPQALARADQVPWNYPDPALARFLSDVTGRQRARVIVAPSDAYASNARAATNSIPIVTVASADPVGLGFAQSLARPGGNTTGLATLTPQLDAKRIELLHEALPTARHVAVLWDPNDPVRGQSNAALQDTAATLGLRLTFIQVRWDGLTSVLSDLDVAQVSSDPLDALLLLEDAQQGSIDVSQVATAATARRLPAVFATRAGPESGGLLSYGPSLPALAQRAAEYVDRLLRGARPETLPIEQASAFELVVNSATASALGLSLPSTVLAQASEVLQPAAPGRAAAGGSPAAGSGPHTLTIALDHEPEHLDPRQGGILAVDVIVQRLLWRGLFDFDAAGAVVPALAAELPTRENGGISADGLTFTVRLKANQTFRDGSPLTAQDLEYSIKRLFEPGHAGVTAADYFDIAGAEAYSTALGTPAQPKTVSDAELARLREVVGVRALDASTLVLIRDSSARGFTSSFLTRIAMPALYPVQRSSVEGLGAAKLNADTLIGNGPFLLQEHVPNDHLTLVPNPLYTLEPKPRLQRLTIRIVSDPTQRIEMYKRGELDLANCFPIQAVPLAADPAYRDHLRREPLLAIQYVAFNPKTPPFDDGRVRRALARAIDRDALVAQVFQGYLPAGATILPPGMPGYDPANQAIASFDPAAARAALAEAGYPDGRGFPDGVTLLRLNQVSGKGVLDFVVQSWRQVLNISVNVQPVDDILPRIFQGQYQSYFGVWIADFPHPEDFLQRLFASNGRANPSSRYSNPAFDAACALAGAEPDPAKQVALWSAAERIVLDDCPFAVLFYPELLTFRRPRVTGLRGGSSDLGAYGDAALDLVDTTA